MTSRLALRPDLEDCILEDRMLLAYAPGLQTPQFIPTGAFSPSFIVSGFSQQGNSGPGSGGNIYPGPQFFYLPIGLANGGGGIRLGGAPTIYNPGSVLPTVQGPAVGSGAESGGAGGYGGSISSGYNTALSSSNNYGMGTTPLGSITAHISGTTDQLIEAQAANSQAQATAPAQDTSASITPPAPPPNAGQGPISSPDRLLGKGLGGPNGLLIGPGMNRPPTPPPSMSSPRH